MNKAVWQVLVLGVIGLGYHDLAWAWGPEGHAMVADMAEMHLTARTQAQVVELLQIEGRRHLDAIASWPDAMRASHPETGPWHYVDIPLYAQQYDAWRDCHEDWRGQRVTENTCIVAKLPEFVRQLGDKRLSRTARLLALKWVVHLVADIHQPLHTEDDRDHGGNMVKVVFAGKVSNLHAVWDLGVIEQHYGWQLGPHYYIDRDEVRRAAKDMDARIGQRERESWADAGIPIQADAVAWANASHALACTAYRHLPANPLLSDWNASYQQYAWPVIQQQLQKSSVRLAMVLNQTLGQ